MDENRTLVRAVGAEPARLSSKNTVEGLVAPTGVWVEIDSAVEGNFMEQIADTAFDKTTAERRDKIRAIFHHGRDSSIGFKVLGPIERLERGEGGLRYGIKLLDTQYNAELRPGIEEGLYGTSFKGTVVKRDINRRPAKSEHNPKGLPEVTYTEIRLHEFGLTPLPVYEGTTATMRSLVDDEIAEKLASKATVGPFNTGTAFLSSTGTNTTSTTFDRSDDDDKPFGISRSRYENILALVGEKPWAITPHAMGIILSVIGERASGYRPSPEEIKERIGLVERAEADTPADSPVAVIPIHGPIVPRANLFADVSGMTSVEGLQSQLRAAVESEDVKSILLDVDSPGGSVDLIPELADDIRKAAKVKPVVAVANTMAASAAYWLAAQASEFYVTPSGQVGSIGVLTAHDDVSAMQEKLGVSTTLVSAGRYKVEGNPYEPLSDEARAYLQSRVDEFYQMFVNDVAKGRGVSSAAVKSGYGEGRMLLSTEAAAAGMVDGVATYDETFARLSKQASSVKRSHSEPEPSAATTRTNEPTPKPGIARVDEPERSVATTRTAPIWGSEDAPYWRL